MSAGLPARSTCGGTRVVCSDERGKTIDYFEDDGGTPQWRELHSPPQTYWAGVKQRFHEASFISLCFGVVALGFIIPWCIIIFGLLGMVALHAIKANLL